MYILIETSECFLKLFESTELMQQTKPRKNKNKKNYWNGLRSLFSMGFHWESRFLKGPSCSSYRFHWMSPVFRNWMRFFLCVMKKPCSKRGSLQVYCQRRVTRKLATVCFLPVLNTDHPVFNLIDYLLLKKIPKVALQKQFDMFLQSLQVTFEIFCSDVAQIGCCFFLDQTQLVSHQLCKFCHLKR